MSDDSFCSIQSSSVRYNRRRKTACKAPLRGALVIGAPPSRTCRASACRRQNSRWPAQGTRSSAERDLRAPERLAIDYCRRRGTASKIREGAERRSAPISLRSGRHCARKASSAVTVPRPRSRSSIPAKARSTSTCCAAARTRTDRRRDLRRSRSRHDSAARASRSPSTSSSIRTTRWPSRRRKKTCARPRSRSPPC